MTTATVTTTEVRDELVERINTAYARLLDVSTTSTLAFNDYNEYRRLNGKRLALRTAQEMILSRINADDVQQFNAVKDEVFKEYRIRIENNFDAGTEGGRSGYSLVIDYMRYSIGLLGNR
jgi:hypothetical protein